VFESGPYILEVNVSIALTVEELEEDICQALKADQSLDIISCCVSATIVGSTGTLISYDVTATIVYRGTCGSGTCDDKFEEILTSNAFEALIGGNVVSFQPATSKGSKSSKSASRTGGSKSSKSATAVTGGSKSMKSGTGGSMKSSF